MKAEQDAMRHGSAGRACTRQLQPRWDWGTGPPARPTVSESLPTAPSQPLCVPPASQLLCAPETKPSCPGTRKIKNECAGMGIPHGSCVITAWSPHAQTTWDCYLKLLWFSNSVCFILSKNICKYTLNWSWRPPSHSNSCKMQLKRSSDWKEFSVVFKWALLFPFSRWKPIITAY